MQDDSYIGFSIDLANPINKQIESIKEGLYKRTVQNLDNGIYVYGTFETSYHRYKLEQNRQGKKVTLRNYYDSILSEIQQIWDGAIGTETNLRKAGKDIQLHSVFNNIRAVRQLVNDLMLDIDKVEHQQPNDNIAFNASYETESLAKIVFPNNIKNFIAIENRLFDEGYINNNCVWVKDKKDLVGLIHVLNDRKYFKPISGRSKNNYFKYYRHYFEDRYRIDIAEMAKPSKSPVKKMVEDYKVIYHFIDLIQG